MLPYALQLTEPDNPVQGGEGQALHPAEPRQPEEHVQGARQKVGDKKSVHYFDSRKLIHSFHNAIRGGVYYYHSENPKLSLVTSKHLKL